MKSKETILSEMKSAMPWILNEKIEPYILEAMSIYAEQQAKEFAKWALGLVPSADIDVLYAKFKENAK